jgi:WD repeat and FYVE domain-containing protein 3
MPFPPGVRIFVPNPVSKTIEYIGGPHVMLGLIAMSNDIESFYASVKAFVCVLKANKQMQNELLRTRAYQVSRVTFQRVQALIDRPSFRFSAFSS